MTIEVNKKELGTIVFSLEEYAKILEIEQSYEARNNVYELIWRISQ